MRWIPMLAAVVLAGLLSTPARAEEPHGDAHGNPAAAEHATPAGHADDAAHGAGHGPNYDLLSPDGATAVWTIGVFLALLLILRVVAWKPIQQVLVQREKFIAESLAAAKREREEAQRVLAQYTKQVEAARAEASAIVEEGRRDGEVLKHKIEQDARAEADKALERARREITIATDTAVKRLYELGARLATDAAAKIIKKELNAKDHERLIAESIEDLNKATRN